MQELSVAVSRKDAFLAVVGHELRTPLNAICQLASALSLGAGVRQHRGPLPLPLSPALLLPSVPRSPTRACARVRCGGGAPHSRAAGQVSSQAREWLSTIKASASHLLGVVNDIIMFRANQMGLVIKQVRRTAPRLGRSAPVMLSARCSLTGEGWLRRGVH